MLTAAWYGVPVLIALAVVFLPVTGIALFAIAALSPVVVPVAWAVHHRLS